MFMVFSNRNLVTFRYMHSTLLAFRQYISYLNTGIIVWAFYMVFLNTAKSMVFTENAAARRLAVAERQVHSTK